MQNWVIPIVIFVSYTVWWLILQQVSRTNTVVFDYFASTYCILAIWGGILGITNAHKWGGIKSMMGKAILFFALGLFAQAFGQLAYSYYVVILHIEVPYPSLGDLGYFGSIPLYICGVFYLAQASGLKFSLKSFANRIQAGIIPVIMLIISYVVFLKDYEFDWTAPLAILLDFGYPLGEAIYLSLALLAFLLLRGILGGIMKYRVLLILLALFIQYLADFTFLYQAYNGTYLAAGINDYMYIISYFAMTLGLLQLSTQSIKKNLEK